MIAVRETVGVRDKNNDEADCGEHHGADDGGISVRGDASG